MLSNEETIKWLKENRMNEYGDLELAGLDLSKDFENVFIGHLQVKGFLYQQGQRVDGDLFQGCQKVGGSLFQDHQTVTGDLYQENQKVIDGIIYDGDEE